MDEENSYFDGKLLQLIGWKLLGGLITICTIGICYPWAFTMIYNWETKHTVIKGERLHFDGTAGQLFGNWIKWLLLTIITLGIYGLWLPIKLAQWKTKHTSFISSNMQTENTSSNDNVVSSELPNTQLNCKPKEKETLNKNTIIFALISGLIPMLLQIIMRIPFIGPFFTTHHFGWIGGLYLGISTTSLISLIFIIIVIFVKNLNMKSGIIVSLGSVIGTVIGVIISSAIYCMKVQYRFRFRFFFNFFISYNWIRILITSFFVIGISALACFICQKTNKQKKVNS